jgi:putative DNA primase/helicase
VEHTSDTLAAALAWHDAGCAVIPIRADGSKAPLVAWKAYQTSPPARMQVHRWFVGGPPGLGLICGAASGNLEMLELEGRAVAEGLGEQGDCVVERQGFELQLWGVDGLCGGEGNG